MTFPIFTHTTVILSKEVIEQYGDCVSQISNPEGELCNICLENDVKSTITNDDKYTLEGDWSALIAVYNSIVKSLNRNLSEKQAVLINNVDDESTQQSIALINGDYRDENQTTLKIPDPIIYSFSVEAFTVHPKMEDTSTCLESVDTLETDNTEETLQIKQELNDAVALKHDENVALEDMNEKGAKNIHETSTKTRLRKCRNPKKTVKTPAVKIQTSKKNNSNNGQDKKKPSSLKPKKSWSQKILKDENTGVEKNKDQNQVDEKIDHPSEQMKNVLSKAHETDAKEEKRNDSDEDWTPNKECFQVKGSKALKMTLKKNMRSSRQKKTMVEKETSVVVQTVEKDSKDPPDKKQDEDHTVENIFNCSKCSYFAKKKGNLREHMQRMHDDKVWECEFCGKTFSIQKDLIRHEKSHGCPHLCCDFCGKMYKSRRTFLQHKKSHEDDYIKPEYECEICKKSFSTKYVLNYHVKSEHKGIKKQFLCPTCGKSFTQKNSYIQHANVHMGLKPYQCEHCGKSFAYEKSLKEHRYMHDDILHFKCDVCDKHFRQKSALQIHRKIHNETKDHLCGVCGKGFTQRQALLRHERIHNGDKPFKCGICSRTFSDASIIRRHMILVHKKHTKEWREDVICDLKGADDYWIEGKKPEGRIKRLPESKKTTIEVEETNTSDPVENKTDTANISTQILNEGEIINQLNLQRPSLGENNILSTAFEQASCEGEFINNSLYSDEQMMKETSMYLKKNQTMLHPNADGTENDVMLNQNISQYLSNPNIPMETSTSVNLDHTFNETFTSIHDRKSEERLTNPFQTSGHMRSAGNQWTAEPYSFNSINYISQYTNYPNP